MGPVEDEERGSSQKSIGTQVNTSVVADMTVESHQE